MKLNAKFRAIIAIAMMLVGWLPTLAYDFCVDGIYYNILSETDKTVEVTYKNKDYTSYSGDIVIPELVTYNEIEYSVTSIGYNAFKECVGLSSIFIPNSVITIGDYAFSGCRNLYQIDLPNSISSIGSGAFKSARIRNITIPENVKTISPYTFEYSSLLSINIHNGVESIRGYAFRQCSLETINIPEGITEIEAGTFEYCGNLTTVYLPNSISEIYDYAFANCTSLKELYILRCDPPRVNSYAFQNLSNSLKVYVPFGCKSEYEAANYWKYLNIIELDPIFAESITLDQNEISLNIAETSELIATIIPEETTNKTVAWTSSDESVATVGENGLVTAIAAGEAIITATTQDGSNLSATCKVIVKPTLAESITLDQTEISLYVAETAELIATILPEQITNKSVIWSSSDESVATVDENGLVTAISVGEATITATTADGSNLSVTCNITVKQVVLNVGTTFEYDNLKYEVTVKGKEVAVTRLINSNYSGDIVIPESVSYEGVEYSVTSIGKDAFYNRSGLTSIEIPNSVTSIGRSAFNGCSGLTSVTIGNSVTSIGDYAFYGCSGLTSVTIGNLVTSIGAYAFSNCKGLTSIEIPNSVTSIGNEAFSYCKGLTSVTIGNSVTSIGEDAFSGCSGLTNVYINDLEAYCNIEFRGDYGYAYANPVYYAKNLYLNGSLIEDLVIPEGVTKISDAKFYGLNHIKSVTIPNSVTSISDNAFCDCSGLTSIEIPNSVTSIGDLAFGRCTGLTSIEIPNSVTSIGESAFYGCSGLTSIEIPNSVTSIGNGAFSGCSGLTNVYINDLESYCNIEFANSYANPVYNAKNLYLNGSLIEDLVIPEGVTKIADYLFYELNHIKTVTIPNSVTSIGYEAFYGCKGLTSVYINDLEAYCNIEFANHSANPVFDAKNLYLNGSLIEDLVIPEGVTKIADYLFYELNHIKTVTIPNSVTSIGQEVFKSCTGLTSVTIGNSVTSIGDYAFSYCSGLTSIEIPNSVTSIGKEAFHACGNLTGILTLPASITYIGDNAFSSTGYKVCIALNEEPITISSSSLPALETLIVPFGSKEAYEAASYWKDAESIIEEGSCDIEVTNLTGGKLMSVIATEARKTPANVTGIKVNGILNDTDLAAIKSNMTSLLRLDISNTDYAALPDKAFKDKLTLMDIKLPNGLKSIGAEAFSGCVALNDTIIIPKTVTTIGNSAFLNCSSVPAITLSEGLNTIGDYAFRNCGMLTEITVPSTVTSIGNYAFADCKWLVSASLPDKLTSIANCLFSNCAKLADFIFPAEITTIGSSAFYGCSKLDLVDLSACNKLTSIGNNAFENCSNIATINFPTSLTSIGVSAFRNCRSLTEMSVPTLTPPTIADDAKPFYHVDNLACVLSIPKDSMIDYLTAQYWGAFVSIEEKEEINVEVGTEEEIENGGNNGNHGNGNNGNGYGHDKHGCDVHYHKGGSHKPHKMPGMYRAQAIEETPLRTANAITYSGSSVFVEGEECVTFVLTPQEGYEIEKVLYGGEDVTSQLINNTFTTPVAEAGKNKKMQVILAGDTKYILGDANADLVVNVTDVVAITNHILGSSSENFQADASDVNGDGSVNVTDVVAVTNIILGVAQVNELPSEDSTTSSELTLTDNGINDNGIQTIDVALFNDRDFTAFQADLRLPVGMELVDVVLSDRASSSHSMNLSVQADGSYRMISYSMVNEAYADNNGTLFTLVLKSTNAASGELVIEDIIFTTPQAIGYNLDDVVMEVAGTTALSTLPTDTRIYAQDGYIVIESPADCIAVISGVDGVARQVAVNAGINKFEAMKGKVYIVKTLNSTVKVMM